MQHVDEGTIHAWLDGELSGEAASRIEAHIQQCEECSRRVAEERGLVAGASRILSALDDVPGAVLPSRGASLPRRKWHTRPEIRAAAAVLLVLTASLLVSQGEGRRSERLATADAAAGAAESRSDVSAEQAQRELPFAEVSGERAQSAVGSGSLNRQSAAPGSGGPADQGAFAAAVAAPSGQRVTAVPPAVPAAAPANEADEGIELVLRVIRADSSLASRTIVYELRPGVQVTLVESRLEPADVVVTGVVTGGEAGRPSDRRMEAAGSQMQAAKRRAATAAASAPVQDSASFPGPPAMPLSTGVANAGAQHNELVWTDSAKQKQFRLSGPVPIAELEWIRSALFEGRP